MFFIPLELVDFITRTPLAFVSKELVVFSHTFFLYLNIFVYLPATDVPPTTTTQLATAAGSPNHTAIATDTGTTSISTRPTPSVRFSVIALGLLGCISALFND